MITEEEARKRNLPGSDVFLRTQLAYKDELNRDALIVHLNREAYKAFIDTITISQYPLIQKEREALLSGVKMFPPTIYRQMEYMNFEVFKIATGFELHLKACLLANDIVIHCINNDPPSFKVLRKKQREEPIYKQDLFTIEGFCYNGELNILRGLTSQSLSFDQILKLTYLPKLGKSEEFLNIVEDYRNLRNQIHMPGDPIETQHLSKYTGDSLIKLLVNFINKDIVEWNDKLVEKWKLHLGGKIPRIEYF